MSLTKGQVVNVLNRIVHVDDALDDLSPMDFEALVAFLFTALGYEVRTWQETGDRGADIVVRGRDPLGMDSVGVIECKKYRRDHPVPIEAVRQLYGYSEFSRTNWAALVTTSRFTSAAAQFAKGIAPRIHLVGRELLLDWIVRARQSEEDKAGAMVHRLDRLALRELGRIVDPRPDGLRITDVAGAIAIPPEYKSRLLQAEELPLRLLQAVLTDPRHLQELTPRQFEEFVAEIVDGLGFTDVTLTPKSGDGGRDVIASRLVNDIPLTFYFECKKYAEGNKVQLDTLRALLGTVAHHGSEANIGVLVTSSTFTKGCRELIASESRLDGKDYDGLMGWVDDYKRTFPPTG